MALQITSLPRERDRAGRAALHYAALEGRADEVREAIARGEDVGVADDAGFTPLHFAAQQGQAEAARRLVAAGAPLEARNGFGNSPLWVAVTNRSTHDGASVVEMLLAAGASVDSTNNAGVSVREVAERMGISLPV